MNKKTRKTRLINKFIRIFSLSFLLFVVVAAIGTIIYVQVASNNIFSKLKGEDLASSTSVTDASQGSLTQGANSAILEKKITTVAIFGVDKQGWRTDVVMLAIFNHQTYDVDIISIPRDTKITIPTEIYEDIKASRSDVSQVERINNIPAYVEEKKRNDTSVAILEEVFGISVDYYVNLDLNGFKYIVDAVGPVMVDVPMDMKYTDLEQDLIINLDKGLQEINGARAEQLIRYRKGYANADIGRIDTQHLFMKAFMEKILEPNQKFNMTSIIQTVLVNVTTDFKDVVDYMTYLDKLSADKVHMVTIPGG
ncbi:MAG: LCP family protein, partial [Vallitaleaceae bacterium]|nr:LCP family protein [Vallitaleaceae bacterium]